MENEKFKISIDGSWEFESSKKFYQENIGRIEKIITELMREGIDSEADRPQLKYTQVPDDKAFEGYSIAEFNDLMEGFFPVTEAQLRYLCGNHEIYDVSNLDTSRITDMSYLFEGAATSFNQDIGGWDVSNVTNMRWMFCNATSFNQYIGSWDVSKVTDMRGMFYKATTFSQYIGSWDVSNVTDMGGMFARASSFNQEIGSWDVSNVKYKNDMFLDCPIQENFKPNIEK